MEKKDTSPQLTEEELKAIGEIELGPAKHEIFLNNHYKKLLVGILIGAIGAGTAIAYFSNRQDESDLAASMVVDSLQGDASYNTSSITELQSQYAHSPAAATAQLIQALAKLEGADVEVGISDLQSIAGNATDITIASRAAAAVANYYMAEGINDKASAAWHQVANMEQNPYSALAYMSLGDIAKNTGDNQTARSFYQTAQAKCATSSLINAKDIEMRLLLLDVDAPKPVIMAASTTESNMPDSDINTSIDTNIELDAGLDSLPPLTPTE